jgi:hypothetical protein
LSGVADDRKQRRENPPQQKYMNKLNSLLIAVAVAGTLGVAVNASAQSQLSGGDGIAASPKVRQMLNERKAALEAASAPSSVVVSSPAPRATSQGAIAASPKVRQMIAEGKPVTGPTTPAVASSSVGYQAAGEDRITASPKLREQLNQRGGSFMIAPIK